MSKFTVNTEALVGLRVTAGLQAKDLAERARISPSFLCDIEAGRRVPRPDVARRIADVFGVPVGAFFSLNSKPTSEAVNVGAL